MANPLFGPYAPYSNPQYPPWMYQRTYPFPGFRQTGACPQHGAFYGHGACFQLPQNRPAAVLPRVIENSSTHINPAATGLGTSAQQVPVLTATAPATRPSPPQQVPVLTATNPASRPSPTNILSPRAEAFVPISAQDTTSSSGDSDFIKSRNSDIGQKSVAHKDNRPGHDLSVLPNAPGQTEIGRNIALNQSTSATVEPGLRLAARHDALVPTEPGLVTRHDTVASIEPDLDLNAHHKISSHLQSGPDTIVRHTGSANIEASQHHPAPSNPFVQNLSQVAAFQQNLQPAYRNLFPYADQERTNGAVRDDTSVVDSFDQFATTTPTIPSASHTPQPQVNPYAQDSNTLGLATYYPASSSFSQPLQHHLYAALGPHREPPQPNQRLAQDFFISEDLRQLLQKKTEATLATFPNSTLPPSIAHFHSLVPLVHNNQKNANLFGYPSWIYKAVSSKDGKVYCLRRLQGYRLTNDVANETAVRSVQQNWKRVRNGNVVTVFLAFTNSAFGDSSLIFVTDFHPLAETLAQKHFTPTSRFPNRHSSGHIPEAILWGYIVQIASALKAIHSAGLAARVIDASKVIMTSENRIRLNACAIMDVVKHDSSLALVDLQRQDLCQFGRLLLALGTNNLSKTVPQARAMEAFSRPYTSRLRESVSWLLSHDPPEDKQDIDIFLSSIATDVITVFDASLHLDDELHTDLNLELENSRILRLLTKLNFINERPEYEHDRQWAEQGNRYILQLFRDYVFHQVDAQGNPVLDLAHVLTCLNKLDVGIEEKVTLTARDENTVVVVSYREIRTAVEAAWGDLMRRAVTI